MTGKNMKLARKRLRMTQTALAEKLDISREAVGLMERGLSAVQKRTELSLRYLMLVNDGRSENRQINLPFM